jgi:hypothetical protein
MHPSGDKKMVVLGIADTDPMLPLEAIIRIQKALWRRYTDNGWVVEAIYGSHWDAHGHVYTLQPLDNLLKVMAEVVGEHNVIRPAR